MRESIADYEFDLRLVLGRAEDDYTRQRVLADCVRVAPQFYRGKRLEARLRILEAYGAVVPETNAAGTAEAPAGHCKPETSEPPHATAKSQEEANE